MARSGIQFIGSWPGHQKLPDLDLPEIAFAGRSNVGKSTLIGQLLKNPKLVRTSRTPGRTQLLNVFVYQKKIALIDMPGYGYAKLSKSQRQKMDAMVRGYLRYRKNLQGVIQVVDSRREVVSEYDAFVAGWILENKRNLLIALTKIDCIPKNKRLDRARRIEKQLGLPIGAAVICSGKTGEGRDELHRRLWELTQ